MRFSLVSSLFLGACQLAGGDATSFENTVTLDGQTCTETLESDVLPFCLEGTSAFEGGTALGCDDADVSAAVWLAADALTWSEDFTLGQDASNLSPGEGEVWLNEGDQTWATRSGTATLSQDGDTVHITFEGEFEDFLDGTPGPSGSGSTWCQLSR